MNWLCLLAEATLSGVETYGPLAGMIIITSGFLGYLKLRDAADRIEREAERKERIAAHAACEETVTKVVDRQSIMLKDHRDHMMELVKTLGSNEGG